MGISVDTNANFSHYFNLIRCTSLITWSNITASYRSVFNWNRWIGWIWVACWRRTSGWLKWCLIRSRWHSISCWWWWWFLAWLFDILKRIILNLVDFSVTFDVGNVFLCCGGKNVDINWRPFSCSWDLVSNRGEIRSNCWWIVWQFVFDWNGYYCGIIVRDLLKSAEYVSTISSCDQKRE